jgi:hypothetical protein
VCGGAGATAMPRGSGPDGPVLAMQGDSRAVALLLRVTGSDPARHRNFVLGSGPFFQGYCKKPARSVWPGRPLTFLVALEATRYSIAPGEIRNVRAFLVST